jgi:hypothetical protein
VRDGNRNFTDETNSHHLLQDMLVTGIHNWLNGLPFPNNQYPPDWHELIDCRLDGNNSFWGDSL